MHVSDAQMPLVYISQTCGSYYKAPRNNIFDSPVRMFTRQSQLRLHSFKPNRFLDLDNPDCLDFRASRNNNLK